MVFMLLINSMNFIIVFGGNISVSKRLSFIVIRLTLFGCGKLNNIRIGYIDTRLTELEISLRKRKMRALKLTAVAAILASATFASSVMAVHTDACTTSETLLARQTAMGVIWMQQSGEYTGLVTQAFNMAKVAFDNNQPANGMKKGVISDLDETLISNSAYAGWQVENAQPYSSKTWAKWVEARQATAIEGAVDYAKYVNSHGGKMFYVSNRKVKGLQATIDNLKALGFPGVSEETVLLREKSSNKVARFEKVKSMGYDAVVYLGDNLNDFTGETYHKNNEQRRAFVASNKEMFGTKYIVLPNPNYGGWEGGMADGYYKNDVQGKLKLHDEIIDAWNGQ